MLHLSTPVYFGNFHRFKAFEYTSKYYHLTTIFVTDAEQTGEFGLPQIVFQEWAQEITDLDQVISIVRKRYPDAFDDLYPDTTFVSPQRESDKDYWHNE